MDVLVYGGDAVNQGGAVLAAHVPGASFQVSVGECAADTGGDGSGEADGWSLAEAGAWECVVCLAEACVVGPSAGACVDKDEAAATCGRVLELEGACTGAGSCMSCRASQHCVLAAAIFVEGLVAVEGVYTLFFHHGTCAQVLVWPDAAQRDEQFLCIRGASQVPAGCNQVGTFTLADEAIVSGMDTVADMEH